MALNVDGLGMALFAARGHFDNRTLDDLLSEYGGYEAIRLAAAKKDAEAIINHFKALGVINVTVVTTGTATNHTGTGTGTIS